MAWTSVEKESLYNLEVVSGPKEKQNQLPCPMEASIPSNPWRGSVLDRNWSLVQANIKQSVL